MKLHRIADDTFGFRIIFVEGTAKEFDRLAAKTFPDDKLQPLGDNVGGHTTADNQTMLLWAENARRRGAIPVIMHELMHVAAIMADARGIPFRHENDEVFAYYVEMLSRQILKRLGHIA